MAGALTQIVPLNPPLDPPPGSEAAGVGPGGRQLWKLTRKRSRAVPDIGPDGEQRWKVNPLNGERLYPLNKAEIYDEELVFYLESQGNGNVEAVPYTPPTPEELAALERERRIREEGPKLLEALLDSGVTAEDLRALKAREAAAPEPEAKERVPEPTDPVPVPETVTASVTEDEDALPEWALDDDRWPAGGAGGVYLLPDGEKIRGRENAEAHLKALRELAAEAAGATGGEL